MSKRSAPGRPMRRGPMILALSRTELEWLVLTLSRTKAGDPSHVSVLTKVQSAWTRLLEHRPEGEP